MPEFAGDAALYFDPSSPAELAEHLAALLGDAERMRDLSARAQARSLLYDWQTTAATTWKLIEGAAEETRAADLQLQGVKTLTNCSLL